MTNKQKNLNVNKEIRFFAAAILLIQLQPLTKCSAFDLLVEVVGEDPYEGQEGHSQ